MKRKEWRARENEDDKSYFIDLNMESGLSECPNPKGIALSRLWGSETNEN